MARQRYTATEVADALKESRGFVTVAADRLGCHYETVNLYIDRYDICRRARQEAHERAGDRAEAKLYEKAVRDGDTASLIFLLKTQYKDRGYVERLELDVKVVGQVKKIERLVIEQGLDVSIFLAGIIEALGEDVREPEPQLIEGTARPVSD